MQGKLHVLDAMIDRYFYGNSWAEMVTDERRQVDAHDRCEMLLGYAVLSIWVYIFSINYIFLQIKLLVC